MTPHKMREGGYCSIGSILFRSVARASQAFRLGVRAVIFSCSIPLFLTFDDSTLLTSKKWNHFFIHIGDEENS